MNIEDIPLTHRDFPRIKDPRAYRNNKRNMGEIPEYP